MTAPIYKTENNSEFDEILTAAPATPVIVIKGEISRMMAADAQPASSDATTYLHTVATTGATPKWMGLPAYQNAGIVRSQKDAVQAAATPAGPQ
jgi:hypothetical protein